MRGPNHPDTLISISGLASLLEDQGKLDDAESLYRRALEGSEKVRGPNHPDTLLVMYKLSSLLKALDKLQEAEHMARQSLEGYTARGMESHVRHGVQQLVAILFKQGKSVEARAVQAQYT